jgi:1,4-dihydroxy-2-naphthoate polyprenyltransferase
MPVYWLALSQTNHIDIPGAIIVFVVLHLLVYPSSNGYNSYMDRDTGSIGGLQKPMPATKQLYHVSIGMDLLALSIGYFVSPLFATGLLLYIAASRCYSYRGIRLKKYPIIGYLTVIIFQGALIFFLVMHGCSSDKTREVPLVGMIAASLMIGSFYPLTQIYQHMQDKEDGVITISFLLGYRGTFLFSAFIYFLAMLTLGIFLSFRDQWKEFIIIQLILLPVLVNFLLWFSRVYRDAHEANFRSTMRMNALASFFTNLAFIYLLVAAKS